MRINVVNATKIKENESKLQMNKKFKYLVLIKLKIIKRLVNFNLFSIIKKKKILQKNENIKEYKIKTLSLSLFFIKNNKKQKIIELKKKKLKKKST